jgi:hypothetical protein
MVTMAVASKHIDMSDTNFKTLLNKGVFKRAARGDYNLDDIRIAYIRHMRAEKANDEGGAKSSLSESRARKTTADAEISEFELAKQKGEWARIDVMPEYLIVENLMMRENFIGVSGKIADSLHMIDRDAAYLIVKDAIYECLNRIATGKSSLQYAIDAIEHAGGKPKLLERLETLKASQEMSVEVDDEELRQMTVLAAAPRKSPIVAELVDLLAGRTPREIYEILRDEWYRVIKESHSPDFVLPSPMIMRFAEVLVGRSKSEINAIFRAVLGAVEEVIHAELTKALDGLSDPNGVSFHGTRADVRGIRGIN